MSDLPDLSVEEWNAAMAVVMAAHTEEIQSLGEETPATAMTNMPKKSGPKRRPPAKMMAPKGAPTKAANVESEPDPKEGRFGMADGSFFIADEGDLRAKIDAVASAEMSSQDKVSRPYALDVKAHIVQRAEALSKMDLVPSHWLDQLRDNDMLPSAGQPNGAPIHFNVNPGSTDEK